MKVLIVGINYSPEIISTAVYTSGLAKSLTEAGDTVNVVTAQPYFPAWKVSEGHPRFWWCRRRDGAVKVIHCPHYVPQKPTGLRRVLHHASFALSALPVALWQALTKRPDVVFVVAPALMAVPVGWLAARISRAKCWLHVQDFEVEAAFSTGLISESGRAGRLARAYERWILGRFDKVSSISDTMLKKLREKGVAPGRVTELRNWANLSAVTPLTAPSVYREELGLPEGRRVALYSGSIGNKQGLEIIPTVARMLADRDLTFVICGDGPFLAELKQLSEGLDNICFQPLQPIERLGELLGLADIHLLPQIAGAADLVLPSKLTNMLASGRPVIATTDPDTALGRAVEGCGIAIPPGEPGALAKSIQQLLDDPELCRSYGAAARQRALDQWDSSTILSRFREQLLQLVPLKRVSAKDLGYAAHEKKFEATEQES